MKVKDIIDKLRELPQDEEITSMMQMQSNDDFTKGMFLGMALCYLATRQPQSEINESDINRFRNISGEFEAMNRNGILESFKS